MFWCAIDREIPIEKKEVEEQIIYRCVCEWYCLQCELVVLMVAYRIDQSNLKANRCLHELQIKEKAFDFLCFFCLFVCLLKDFFSIFIYCAFPFSLSSSIAFQLKWHIFLPLYHMCRTFTQQSREKINMSAFFVISFRIAKLCCVNDEKTHRRRKCGSSNTKLIGKRCLCGR